MISSGSLRKPGLLCGRDFSIITRGVSSVLAQDSCKYFHNKPHALHLKLIIIALISSSVCAEEANHRCPLHTERVGHIAVFFHRDSPIVHSTNAFVNVYIVCVSSVVKI